LRRHSFPTRRSSDLAEKVKYSIRFVQKIQSRPEFQERLAKQNALVDKQLIKDGVKSISDEIFLKDAARKELERASLHAAKTITTLLTRRKKMDRTGLSEMKLKFEAAKDVLDRIGLKPREVVETIERNYTTEEITSAMDTMKELTTISQNQFVFGGQVRKLNRPRETATSTSIEPTDSIECIGQSSIPSEVQGA
jgi:hypothetical protein